MSATSHIGADTTTDSSAVPAGTVVVGVDGSPGSDQALAWAASQAALEHRPLTLVYSAYHDGADSPYWAGPGPTDVPDLLEEVRRAGLGLLATAERRVGLQSPDLVVGSVLSMLDPREVLADLSQDAHLVVVGSRGRGPLASLLLGSVSVAVAKLASCPVVVVRRVEDLVSHWGVLVDVDGSEGSLPAIELAYQFASFHSLPLTAMHVVGSSDPHDDDQPPESRVLAESVAGMQEKYPDVHDTLRTVRGVRERELVRASLDMDLLVVATYQHQLVNKFVVGSVATTVIEHATCNVAAVPATARTTVPTTVPRTAPTGPSTLRTGPAPDEARHDDAAEHGPSRRP